MPIADVYPALGSNFYQSCHRRLLQTAIFHTRNDAKLLLMLAMKRRAVREAYSSSIGM